MITKKGVLVHWIDIFLGLTGAGLMIWFHFFRYLFGYTTPDPLLVIYLALVLFYCFTGLITTFRVFVQILLLPFKE